MTMKKLITGALALGMTFSAPLAAALDVDAALEDVAGFTFGDSRKTLIEVENAVDAAETDAAMRAELADGLEGLITGDATLEAKRFACRQLRVVGDAESVGALAGLLDDGDIAAHALEALEALGGSTEEETANAARAALRDAAPKHTEATTALGRLGDEAALPALMPLMGDQPEAVLALADIGTPEACNAIFRAYGDSPSETLADGCLTCADDAGATDFAATVYEDLFQSAPTSQQRAAALKGMVSVDQDAARVHVLKALRGSDDPAMMRYAIGLMEAYPGADNTKAISDLLADADAETRVVLIDALAVRGDSSAAPAITELYEDGDDATRMAVVRALGQVGDVSSTRLLVRAAASDDAALRREARSSLASLAADSTNEALTAMAEVGEEAERAEAILALGARRATEAKDRLMSFLNDSSDVVFEEVQGAMSVLGDAEDLPALLDLLQEAGEDRAREIKKSVVAIADRLPEDVQVDAIVESLKEASEETQVALMDILGRVQNSESLEVLRHKLSQGAEAVQVAAAEALSGWNTAEPLADLSEIAYTRGPSALRSVAYRGHLKLLEDADIPPSEKLTYYEKAFANAENAQEQKRVLAGLSKVPTPGAFKLVVGIDDAELASEQQQAMVSLGGMLAGAMPGEVSAQMQALLESDASDGVKTQAQGVLDLIKGLDKYLTAWAVAGPYYEDGGNAVKLFGQTFPPQDHLGCDDNGDIVWNVAPVGLDRERAYVIDLEQAIGGSERVAFLKTCLESPGAQEATLALGTNDGCKVWLNGEEIHSLNTGRPLTVGQDRIDLKLQAGTNSLVVAVFQHGGAWAMSARLMGEDGVSARLP